MVAPESVDRECTLAFNLSLYDQDTIQSWRRSHLHCNPLAQSDQSQPIHSSQGPTSSAQANLSVSVVLEVAKPNATATPPPTKAVPWLLQNNITGTYIRNIQACQLKSQHPKNVAVFDPLRAYRANLYPITCLKTGSVAQAKGMIKGRLKGWSDICVVTSWFQSPDLPPLMT